MLNSEIKKKLSTYEATNFTLSLHIGKNFPIYVVPLKVIIKPYLVVIYSCFNWYSHWLCNYFLILFLYEKGWNWWSVGIFSRGKCIPTNSRSIGKKSVRSSDDIEGNVFSSAETYKGISSQCQSSISNIFKYVEIDKNIWEVLEILVEFSWENNRKGESIDSSYPVDTHLLLDGMRGYISTAILASIKSK